MSKRPMNKQVNPRLSVRDDGGILRATFARIGARVMTGGDMSAGVRFAATCADNVTRLELPPLDWDGCSLAELRTIAVYGNDYRVREMALAEIEKRVGGVYREFYNTLDTEERRSREPHGGFESIGRVAVGALMKVRESAEELAG